MPVLPLVGSSSSCPGSSSAASTIASATRSLIEPVGFWPSSFAKIVRPGGDRCRSATSGVLPIRSSRLSATIPARHRGQEDHGRVLTNRCVQAAARAHVLAVDVHVHVRTDLLAVVDLLAERRQPRREVLEYFTHRRAGSL